MLTAARKDVSSADPATSLPALWLEVVHAEPTILSLCALPNACFGGRNNVSLTASSPNAQAKLAKLRREILEPKGGGGGGAGEGMAGW